MNYTRRIKGFRGIFILLAVLIVFPFAQRLASAQTLSDCDKEHIYNDTVWYDPCSTDKIGGGGTGNSCTTALIGSDNEQMVWNYFKGQGLSDVQVAGIMGNMKQESNFNPVVMEIGGESQDPYDAGSKGWGIIQWSGNNGPSSTGDKVSSLYKASGLSGPIYELATQLELVWGHMHNNPPITTGDFRMVDFQNITDLREATAYFRLHIEGGSDLGARITYAQDILDRLGGSSPGNPSIGDCAGGAGGNGAFSSPDCQSASGVAVILCEALKYDPVSYEESTRGGHQGAAAWHKSCPSIGAECYLDCSGLVNIAVFDAFGVDLNENTDSERADTKNWQPVQFSQLQPGDLIQPNDGHVEIVDHVEGNTIYTFGAHTSHRPQPEQVGPASFTNDSGNLYLHYIGPGI